MNNIYISNFRLYKELGDIRFCDNIKNQAAHCYKVYVSVLYENKVG